MAARYKSRKPAPTFSNHLNDTKCVLLFSPLKHYKHLQEFQMALKTMPHPPKKSLGGDSSLQQALYLQLLNGAVFPQKDEGLSQSVRITAGGGKVSRMKE